ncbi:MAG: hypothetical protein VW495_14035 [Rhodobiaceae bacterium]
MQDTDWASRDWTYGKLLRDKTIVVTGCASGIGRDTAKLIKQRLQQLESQLQFS